MADLDSSITQILERYKAAVRARDVEALMRLYDPKLRVFDAWGVWSYEGAEAWRTAVEGWFQSIVNEKTQVTFDEVQIVGSADFATVSAIATYAATSMSDEPLRSMQNRLSWVLKTSGHVLRIVHEHTSAPIGFEDQKAILQRVTGR
jgi:ketosteroid isomerase-like protein